MTWEQIHPAINAGLNATTFAFLIVGWRAILRRDIPRHRAAMLSALVAAAIFLASYVVRFLTTGAHRYPGDGWDRTVYLVVLLSHTVLAVGVLPFILRLTYLALTDKFPQHRRIARWTLPVWIYVSVTGVTVYAMLYHLAPRLHP